MIFAGIEERRTEYPVAVRCRVLGVSRAGFYARRNRAPSPAALRRDERATQIPEVHVAMKGRYGSPRLTVALNARGIAGCVPTVARVMKRQGIRAKTVRRFVRTTDSNPRMPVAPNVLDRNVSPARPNTTWGTDITDIPTLEGWPFLALVVDVFPRRIVGWAMGASLTRRRVVDALAMAGNRRQPGVGLVAPSDRGEPVRGRALPIRGASPGDGVQHEPGRSVRG